MLRSVMIFISDSVGYRDKRFSCNLEALSSWSVAKQSSCQKQVAGGFPGGAVVENPPANAGDTGSSPGLGRSHMPRSN